MNDVEQRVAEWLHRETPEPPRAISATQIMDRQLEVRPVLRPGRRVLPPLLAAAAIVTVIVAVLLAVTSSGDDGHPRPAVTPTRPAPTHTTTSPTSPAADAPPPDFAATRLLGASGRYAWKLTSVLRVTADAGAHWTRVPLPAGLTPAGVDTIQLGEDGSIFLADAHRNQTVDLYRRPAGATRWQVTTLSPPPPGTGYQPPYVQSVRAAGNLVTVVTGWGTSYARSVDDVWISTDGGATFVRRRTGLDSGVRDVLFLNSQVGLLATDIHPALYRTTDGGRHWSKLGGTLASVPDVDFGPLVRDGADVLVGQMGGRGRALEVTVLRSTDDGATFQPLATPLRVRNREIPQLPILGISGRSVWFTGGGAVYRSTDGGTAWSKVDPGVVLDRLDPSGPTSAIATIGATCSSNDPKDRCWQTDYLVATADGGRTWHSL